MKLTDAVTDYMQYLRHEQRGTAATCRTYQSGLNSFLEWMGANVKPDPTTFDFHTNAVRRYLYFHAERGLRPRTLRGRMHPIKALAAFLLRNEAIKTDPTATIAMPKKDPAVRLRVSEEDVKAILDACERLADLRRVALSRAVLSTLIFSGLRRQELLDLTVSDFQADESAVKVRHGKGNKERLVYIPEVAAHALSEWIALRPADSRLDWLFMLDRNRRVGHDALAAILEEVKAIAGLRGAPNIKPHSLRHFYASHLVKNGADLEAVRRLLGHADLRTTALYVATDTKHLKHVAQLAALTDTTPQAPPTPTEESRTRLRVVATTSDQERRSRRIAR